MPVLILCCRDTPHLPGASTISVLPPLRRTQSFPQTARDMAWTQSILGFLTFKELAAAGVPKRRKKGLRIAEPQMDPGEQAS